MTYNKKDEFDTNFVLLMYVEHKQYRLYGRRNELGNQLRFIERGLCNVSNLQQLLHRNNARDGNSLKNGGGGVTEKVGVAASKGSRIRS